MVWHQRDFQLLTGHLRVRRIRHHRHLKSIVATGSVNLIFTLLALRLVDSWGWQNSCCLVPAR